MALKTTMEHMKKMLLEISHDLEKAARGNKAAAQRVRTTTIKFAKTAKQYRKESIGGSTTKRKKATKKKVVRKKAATRKKVAKKRAPARKKAVRKVAKRKTTARKRRR